MSKQIKIRDLTLRDGQQSNFATRMTQEQVYRTLPYFKKAGFYAMEVWGGAVPDSVMRYLNENPWVRLEKIKEGIGDASLLTALSRGRNLFGYNPYPEEVIEGFNRNAIQSGVDIMRIFDALNDMDNIASTIRYVKNNKGTADGTVCYTVDPKLPAEKVFFGIFKKQPKFKPLFTVDYFVKKAKEVENLGADMITLKDMAGLVNPASAGPIIRALKKSVSIPVDFHTHCTPGYGLASVLMAIINGVDIVDTNMMTFAGGPAAPAYEIIHLFCKKLDIETNVNIEVLRDLNDVLVDIRKELADYDNYKMFPRQFDLTKDSLPPDIEKLFDTAIEAAQAENETNLLEATFAIEKYFNFPGPNDNVRDAEIPGGMYTNMLAQLKQLKLEALLPSVLEAVPKVRVDAGCPPLVTPTSQIVGVQAVNCVLDENNDKDWYTNTNTQFVNLVKGSYGKTPIPVNEHFRERITGSPDEIPYDTSGYMKQMNKTLFEYGDVKMAEGEKEELLLELFPSVAEKYLTWRAEKNYMDKIRKEQEKEEALRKKQEEEFYRQKKEYDSLTEEEKQIRLNQGLYNFKWTTYFEEQQQLKQLKKQSKAGPRTENK
ncbi:MAG: carboxylase [Marinilabiliales bacterium]|nr:MAG: carboxylase [Marinilabiliales bacterium]